MKTVFLQNYQHLKRLTFAAAVCALLIMARIKITHSLFGLFLIWNLFLALVPLGITWTMLYYKSLLQKPILLSLLTFIWVLFLPNAPYVFTDFVHLKMNTTGQYLFDFILILAFSSLALYAGLISVVAMQKIWKPKINSVMLHMLTFIIFCLCGYGLYLGRVLRYNSWDVLTNPLALLHDVWYFVINPFDNWPILVVSASLGLLLTLIYTVLKSLKLLNTDETNP